MATIEEKRRWRFELLRVLYEEVDGVPRRRDVDYRTLGPKVGLTDPDLRNAVQWLVDNGMAEWVALGGSLGITPEGVNAVEESVTSDAQVHIEVATTAEVQIVERFLGELRRLDDELAAAREERAVIDAERVALEAQLRSPRPNKGVMRAALRGVAWAAQAAGSGVVGAAALRALQLLA